MRRSAMAGAVLIAGTVRRLYAAANAGDFATVLSCP
jgi:hypothetical protein